MGIHSTHRPLQEDNTRDTMKAYGIPIDPPPRSTTNTQDELLVDIVDAPQMGISQPAAAYKQDAEVVYLPGGDQDFGRLPTMAKAEHGLHFTSVGFSVFDKGLPCMGGEDGEKKILTSVTGQVFRGNPSSQAGFVGHAILMRTWAGFAPGEPLASREP